MNASEVLVDLRKKNSLTQEKMATSMSVRPCGFLMSNYFPNVTLFANAKLFDGSGVCILSFDGTLAIDIGHGNTKGIRFGFG
jgi:hypothetical protein